MAAKRSFDKVDSSSSGPNGQSRPRNEPPSKKWKPQAPKPKEESVSWLKSRCRGIERLLQKQKVNADVRSNLERELAAHRASINEIDLRGKRSQMIKKYHMVRFFERQKATRLVKRTRKQIEAATDPSEIERLKSELHIAEVDVAYTHYFPFMDRYESLYPQAKPGQDKDAPAPSRSLNEKRPDMWKVIEEAMEGGESALERIRDRVISDDKTPDSPPLSKQSKGGKKPQGAEKTSAKKQIHEKRNKHQIPKGEDEVDGGDFFELAV